MSKVGMLGSDGPRVYRRLHRCLSAYHRATSLMVPQRAAMKLCPTPCTAVKSMSITEQSTVWGRARGGPATRAV